MFKNFKLKMNTFWELFKIDLVIYKQVVIGEFIDVSIWLTTILVVTTYVFPKMGMTLNYGAIIAIGSIASCGFWSIWSTSTNFISDLGGNKTITYPLTLPISATLVFVKQAFGYVCRAAVPSIIILPLGKFILWNRLDLSQFSWIKFIVIFMAANIFIGFFSIFIASLIKDMNHISQVGVRILFPMWFLSGSQFPLKVMHQFSPLLANISFANPLLYAMEGMRAAVLGQDGSLSYWLCLVMLLFFIAVFGYLGILKLKKRLDCI